MFWRNLWARMQSLGFVVFLVIVGAGAVLVFVPLWHKRLAMQREIRQLDTDLANQENTEKELKGEIEALKSDPSYVERTARSKLNLAKPGETIFRFESNAVPVAATPPAPSRPSR
jgi:cell division protein FtsB